MSQFNGWWKDMNYRKKQLGNREDEALSPVIGTILMVAVTVVLAATVFVAVNGFGNDGVNPPTNAVFKAQAIDTDANGATDRIKITYLTGPSNVANSDVGINATHVDGTAWLEHTKTDAWSPGDFVILDPATANTGTWFVTVRMYGSTLVDRDLSVSE